MRITSLNIPKNKCGENGLDDIAMEHLQQMVLIVGQNGSGKSRLLTKIKMAVEQQLVPSEISRLEGEIYNHEKMIINFNEQIIKFENLNYRQELQGPIRTAEIENLKMSRDHFQTTVNGSRGRIASSYITYDGDLAKRNIVNFVPKNLNLTDPRNLSASDVEGRANNVNNILGVDNLSECSLSQIQDLHTQYWNATHPGTQLLQAKIDEIKKSYNELQSLIKELLGVELGNNERGNATLFDFPIGTSQLSDGQKVLLQLAVAIHSQNLKLSEAILLLDEPENHLHPAAIIDVIEKLKQKIPQGQIWIATHSISLIAHFSDEASLYYLENGKATKEGKGKTIVLESLIGDEERVRRQAEFLEEPVTHAMNTYSAQCLLPPTVVTTGVSDPQMVQIRNVLFNDPTKVIKVLDFGAGKGRLITNLVETALDLEKLKTSLDYVALDCDLVNQDECESQIARIYGNAQHRWFQSYPNLIERHNKGSFDVIVMTNVLHEISPKEWLRFFGSTGELTQLLNDNGHLLLVEDQRIPIGEAAHEFGFIVLDTGALKDLCKIVGNDQQILQASERNGRLKAHLISKDYLMRIERSSIQKALETHCQHSKSEIEALRVSNDKRQSRLFAFWVHQYANTKLALEAPTM